MHAVLTIIKYIFIMLSRISCSINFQYLTFLISCYFARVRVGFIFCGELRALCMVVATHNVFDILLNPEGFPLLPLV